MTTEHQPLTRHAAGFFHDLQFSQHWKCSVAVSSAPNVTLPDGALRVQEHAAWSAIYNSPCARKRVFPRHQGGETNGRFRKVSKWSSKVQVESSVDDH